jgi:hypothetical protein
MVKRVKVVPDELGHGGFISCEVLEIEFFGVLRGAITA